MAGERAIDGSFSVQKIGRIGQEGMSEKSGLIIFLRKDCLPGGEIGNVVHHGIMTFFHKLLDDQSINVTMCYIEEYMGIEMNQPEAILDGKTDRFLDMERDLAIDPHQERQSRS